MAGLDALCKRVALAGVLVVVFLSLTLAACSPAAPTPEPTGWFKAETDFGSLSGYSRGYAPGDETTFEIGLSNSTDEPISGEYTLLLSKDGETAATLMEMRPYEVSSQAAMLSPEDVVLPEELADGTYDLVLLLQADGVTTSRLTVEFELGR